MIRRLVDSGSHSKTYVEEIRRRLHQIVHTLSVLTVQLFGSALMRTCLLMLPNVHLDLTDDGYHDWNFDSWSVYERLDVCILNTRVTHVLVIRSQWSCLRRNTLH